jgi:hypothetical protein
MVNGNHYKSNLTLVAALPVLHLSAILIATRQVIWAGNLNHRGQQIKRDLTTRRALNTAQSKNPLSISTI